jgi:hypothetical protein
MSHTGFDYSWQATSPHLFPHRDNDQPLMANLPDDQMQDIGLPYSRNMISTNHHPEYSYDPKHVTGDPPYTAEKGGVWSKGTRPRTGTGPPSTTTMGSPEAGTPTTANVNVMPNFGFIRQVSQPLSPCPVTPSARTDGWSGEDRTWEVGERSTERVGDP